MVNNIKSFVFFQYKPFSKSQAIKRLAVIMIISAALSLIGNNSILWLSVTGCLWIMTAVLFIFLIVKRSKNEISRFLCDGVNYLHISLLLVFLSYRLITLNTNERLSLLVLLLLVLVITIGLFSWMTFLNIKKGIFNSENSKKGNTLFPLLFGIGGMLAARLFLGNKTQDTILFIAALISLLLSCIVSIGSLNLIRALLFLRIQSNNISDCE